jgi:DNA polymerase III alpha subunit
LESIETALGKNENSKVNFIATVEDTYSAKSRKGTPYLRLTLQDETGVCTAMLFTQKNRDNIANCRRDNGGMLPIKKGIVIVKGIKKDGGTIFADLVRVQDQKIFMKLSEIKGLTS